MDGHSWDPCIEDDDTMPPDANLCSREGWAVFNDACVEARIEMIDVFGRLPYDAAAWDIVCRRAAEGSEYHVAALEHVRRHNEGHFVQIESHIRNTGADYRNVPQPDFDEVLAAVNQYAFTVMRHIVDHAADVSAPRP
ncbi:hypothetical protein BHAOGJBA_1296 [Methylobacterium hispanicum]|uniref:Uncharacterized protein n=1 Tax=Methylobacterium hispanicum TaxID=270350 RepID=A0AAV4ZIX9_9HYPH|nr:hypothetical protein [Methylobacterium hispanicum]GJD87791.1 hypothetical protein BHAOGJBA_1296 [Methylobacterium hispanicum]